MLETGNPQRVVHGGRRASSEWATPEAKKAAAPRARVAHTVFERIFFIHKKVKITL